MNYSDLLTAKDVHELLFRAWIDAGTQQALARKFRVSSQYIGQVLKGRDTPGPSIIRGLGLKPVIAWVHADEVAKCEAVELGGIWP